MKTILAAVLLLSAAGVRAALAPEALDLKPAESQARRLTAGYQNRRARALEDKERVAQDLNYIADELDRETVNDEEDTKSLEDYSQGVLSRIAELRANGRIDPKLSGILDQLEALYRGLPQRAYAADYGGSLVRALNEELRWIAGNELGADEKVALLSEQLSLPSDMPADGDVAANGWIFPEDVPLEKFKKLDPIRVFLMKHHIKRPKSYAKTTPAELIAGKRHVQVGIEMEGTVTEVSGAFDRDYCFNIGDLHLEITPEWRLLHRHMPLPKVGQRIRLKGWSYFDYFHGNELEYDAADPEMGVNRVTVWEVHPVQDVEILK